MKHIGKASLILICLLIMYLGAQGFVNAWGIWFEGVNVLPYIGYELAWVDQSPIGKMFGFFYWLLAGLAALLLTMLPAFIGLACLGFCKYRSWV